MRHISFFSGIGGFDLAAQWIGWENVAHCEINPFCLKILNYYWPHAKTFTDIKTADLSEYAGTIDIVSGGFPCQPYSQAGKRLGTADERHLWPYMLAGIKVIRPRWIVGENVYGIINWNGGMVFNEVCADLEAAGYEVWPYVLPACAVNAPHLRNRVWFVAYADGYGPPKWQTFKKEQQYDAGRQAQHEFEQLSLMRFPSDTTGKRLEGGGQNGQIFGAQTFGNSANWRPISEPTIRNGNYGLPGKLDGITLFDWRNESTKAGGNAVVPQVPFQIFKTIEAYEQQAC